MTMTKTRRIGHILGWTTLAAGVTTAATVLAVREMLKPGRDFDGKVVAITGGSRGLGLALAREFGRRGARLALCARNGAELETAKQRLRKVAPDCFTQVCDVSDRAQVEKFLGAVRQHFGPIDVLVNNAGVIQVGPLENQKLEDFEQTMAVNFWGAVYSTFAVLPEMRRRGSGHIVNISSIGGKVAIPHLLPYSASKFALTGFSQGLATELHGSGVKVTTVWPGLMRTGSQFQAEFKGQHEKEFAWFLLGSSTPLTSMKAERAASQIVNATKRGQRELIIGWQAEMLSRIHGALPELTGAALAQVNRLLPNASGTDTGMKKGRDSESLATRNPITASNRFAAKRLNERHG
ncbi:MAG: SDR family NAD(P)-dependent oxidoreductase [Acidobacteriaceae bacterium]